MRHRREELDRAADDPEDAEQQRQREQRDQDVPHRVQADDQRQHTEQRVEHPRSAGEIVGCESGGEPEDAQHDQLNAEQHGHHHQRAAGPDQGSDADSYGDDPERQQPPPVPAYPGN